MAVQTRDAQNGDAQNRDVQNGDGQNGDGHNGDVQTAIVLQGGGALGAYEYGVLRALYEARPGFTPVAVAGISIGAITAAVLGGARTDPMSALDRLWREKLTVTPPSPFVWLPPQIDRALAVLGNPGMYRLQSDWLTAPWALTSVYETGPLRETLAELVDPDKLNDEATRVFVGATNVGTGEMEFFDSRRPGGLTFEHVAASGSLPPSFPMTEIDGQSYWDGGVFSNTPLSPAINALELAAGGDRAVVRELIVVELFPMTAPIPRTLPDVVERMVQLQYTSRYRVDEKFFAKIDRFVDLIDQVDEALPEDSGIRRDPTFLALRGYRKINHFNVVTSSLPAELSNASDFSRHSIEARIEAGHKDAVAQGIGRVDSPGLRAGLIEPSPAPGTAGLAAALPTARR
ncbi:MAG TPA: patatin-like phospholipase family protein [Blastococcus sp.]